MLKTNTQSILQTNTEILSFIITLCTFAKNYLLEQCNKVFININSIGNTVSASIPIALKDAADKGLLIKGMKVVLSGFGVGLSYGTILIKI